MVSMPATGRRIMRKRTATMARRPVPGKLGRKARCIKPSKKLGDLYPVATAPLDDISSRLNRIRDLELRRICEEVLSDLSARQERDKKRKPSPAASARNFLLAEGYRNARRFLRQDKLAAVNEAVVAVAGCKVTPSDPFATFLLLFSALQGEVTKAARNQIRKQAIALAYAHRRKVPRRYLVGFIHQEGGLKRIVARHMKASRKG